MKIKEWENSSKYFWKITLKSVTQLEKKIKSLVNCILCMRGMNGERKGVA